MRIRILTISRVFFVISILLAFSGKMSAQEGVRVRASFSQAMVPFGIFSDKPGDFHINNDFTFYTDQEYGFGAELEVPTKYKNLYLVAGGFYHYAKEDDVYSDEIYTSENLITLEGTGVYGGLTGRLGWERLGLEATVAAGYFNFDYRMKLWWHVTMLGANNVEYAAETASGVGALFGIGGYVFYKGIGLHPSFRILSVSDDQTLTMKTLNLGLSYKF